MLEVEPPAIEIATARHPHVVDLEIDDHAPEATPTDDETLSDDEFFDCIQPEDGPAVMVPVSVNQPADLPAPTELGPGEVDAPELRSPTPKPGGALPKIPRMFRLLNLVTERGTGGISE